MFSSFFDRKTSARERGDLRSADEAIGRAKARAISVDEMLRVLVGAEVLVPLADEPQVVNGRPLTWKPATVSKPDGSSFIVAFTQPELATAFCQSNANYPNVLLVEMRWALSAVPPNFGMVLNLGSANGFEWDAKGLAEYRTKGPGDHAS